MTNIVRHDIYNCKRSVRLDEAIPGGVNSLIVTSAWRGMGSA